MKITKVLNAASVGAGQIHLCDVTTNSSTTIRASYANLSHFDTSDWTVKVFYNPSSGPSKVVQRSSSSSFPAGFENLLNTSPDTSSPIGILANVDGDVTCEITTSGSAPTVGEVLIIVDIEALVIS